MKWASTLLAAFLCIAATSPRTARAQTVVSIELVLAVDASSSVDYHEYGLQMRGIAHAFRTPEVIDLIGSSGGVAVTLIQWSSWANRDRAIPWRLLRDEASVLSFAAEVERSNRVSVGSLTGIGTAISASLQAIADNQFIGRRRKIDVSGDGQNNVGLPLEQARKLARSHGVTVNALAIETDFANLTSYFRDQIISGPDAFVITAADYQDFARAMQVKLLRELATTISLTAPPSLKRAMLHHR